MQTIVGLAIGDALGAPVEFQRRGTFPLVTDMQSGGAFRLPAGAWTDDTAMALCLADSLLAHPQLDAVDLLVRFCRWLETAENSSTGKCIGVGQNTLRVLGHYRRTGVLNALANGTHSDGNGALMRLAPLACRHWRTPDVARDMAARQSRTTHCSDLSAAACAYTADVLCALIAGQSWDVAWRRAILDIWPDDVATVAKGGWQGKDADAIHATGYVVHTLEAALWAVATTDSFEAALIRAVNLGDDADTIDAVTGHLAGARYGLSAIPARQPARAGIT